ncbi:MAG: hypothetical protein KF894_11740 [Labilithrix sp.]|nr:hypothetical protein [Labilithrix sp.]
MRRVFSSAPLLAVGTLLGAAVTTAGAASCTEAECADLGTCAPDTDGPGADAGRADREPFRPPEASPEVLENPYGAPYPMDNQGWTPRRPGSATPGNVIPNVIFEQTIAKRRVAPSPVDVPTTELLMMADLFDPERRTHDVIVLLLATLTDTGTRPFLDALEEVEPSRTKVLCALGEGPLPGTAATFSEFTEWANTYYWTGHARDDNFTRLSELKRPASPLVVLIDATTMEIALLNAGTMSRAALDGEIAAIRARH